MFVVKIYFASYFVQCWVLTLYHSSSGINYLCFTSNTCATSRFCWTLFCFLNTIISDGHKTCSGDFQPHFLTFSIGGNNIIHNILSVFNLYIKRKCCHIVSINWSRVKESETSSMKFINMYLVVLSSFWELFNN